jgi:hypothetical protein
MKHQAIVNHSSPETIEGFVSLLWFKMDMSEIVTDDALTAERKVGLCVYLYGDSPVASGHVDGVWLSVG